jgi:hypothetical protein
MYFVYVEATCQLNWRHVYACLSPRLTRVTGLLSSIDLILSIFFLIYL